MKAIVLESFGGLENLKFLDIAEPVCRPGEALVRVRACALNHLDLWVREGIPAYKIKLPHILGSDVSGVIAALGEGVSSSFEVGSRVAVSPGRSCGICDFCLGGGDSRCAQYGIIGAQGGPGGYAEYLAVPEKYLLPLSDSIGFKEGAAFPLTFLTAWHMLVTLGQVRPGQTVLVLGAGSGVGVAAIQIAKLAGASVIAASRSEEKLKKARELGADETISSSKDIARQTLKITQGRMADIVFEHVGPDVFEAALKSLAPGGKLITCGSTSGPVVNLDMRYVFSRQLQILGSKMGNLAEMRTVSALVNQGKIKAVIDGVYPLEEAAQAHARLSSQNQFGKIVLEIN